MNAQGAVPISTTSHLTSPTGRPPFGLCRLDVEAPQDQNEEQSLLSKHFPWDRGQDNSTPKWTNDDNENSKK